MHRSDGRVVVIGAGLAGAAAAFGLVQRGFRDVLVLEQEEIPGYYASGRNAAMIRQLVSDPLVRRLVHRSLLFLQAPPAPFRGSIHFRGVGSILLASGPELRALRTWIEADGPAGRGAEMLDPAEIGRRIPPAAGGRHEGGAWQASDGVVDIHALLHGLLEGARMGGAEIRYHACVEKVVTRGGRIVAVGTASGESIGCSAVINAAGAWAGRIGALAGAVSFPLLVLRRHLALSGPTAEVDPGWPFVWNITDEVYFRPETGCALLSPCDEDPVVPGDPPVEPAVMGLLAEKVARCFPALQRLEIQRSWACSRTFAADRRMVLGQDPRVAGFFWAAALGGHGVGITAALTELIPDLLISGESPLLAAGELAAHSPSRFPTGA